MGWPTSLQHRFLESTRLPQKAKLLISVNFTTTHFTLQLEQKYANTPLKKKKKKKKKKRKEKIISMEEMSRLYETTSNITVITERITYSTVPCLR
jgi:hypothetical protein